MTPDGEPAAHLAPSPVDLEDPYRMNRLPTARRTAMEFASSWIDIDRSALHHNIIELRRFLGRQTDLAVVVKGNAYGHGYDPVVPIFEEAGIHRFNVFSVSEAAAFRAVARPTSRLQIMGHVGPEAVPWAVANDTEPWLGADHLWPWYRDELERQERRVNFHIELETGMHRTGLHPDLALDICREIADHPYAGIAGVCTHLAGAEDHRNNSRIITQREEYVAFLDALREHGIEPGLRHVASSSAALLDPECHLDLVRVGIAAYGFWPTREVLHRHRIRNNGHMRLDLRRAITWKSRVMRVQDVEDGDYVGYGDSYQAEGDQRIAVVPVGYSDGFSRGLSNLGHVLIRGRRARILGPVNMNMVQAHITHIPDVQPGDDVVLIGRQGDQEISVASFADYNLVINYELMARLPLDIPRHVHDGPGPPGVSVDEA